MPVGSRWSLALVLPIVVGLAASAAGQTVNDGRNKEWQQFKPYAGVSWDQLSVNCPQDGLTPCRLPDGRPGDWVWATGPQVLELMSYWAPELATQTSSNNPFAAEAFLSTFQPIFSFCGTYSCGASGAGLTSSRDGNGVPIVGSAGWSMTNVSIGGGLGVGPSGTASVGNSQVGAFFFRFTGPGVFAYDDAGSVGSPDGGTAVATVLANDWIGGVRATTDLVVLIQDSTTDPRVGLDPADGSVEAASGVAPGTHTLVYRICDRTAPSSCDDARVTVVVPAYAIDARDDAAGISPVGGIAVASVLANDLLGGAPATTARVTLSTVTPADGLALDTVTGAVTVAPGTALGTHVLVYRICETANPGNCDTAMVSVLVRPNVIDAVNDYGRGSSKVANTPIASVLANDRLNGVVAATPAVILTTVSLVPATSGITLNLTTGAVNVKTKTSSGVYALTYRICEAASPSNCDTAVATIELSGR